ncbi:hypothetical protein MMPV_002108 [Pyropia vietnamensis]
MGDGDPGEPTTAAGGGGGNGGNRRRRYHRPAALPWAGGTRQAAATGAAAAATVGWLMLVLSLPCHGGGTALFDTGVPMHLPPDWSLYHTTAELAAAYAAAVPPCPYASFMDVPVPPANGSGLSRSGSGAGGVGDIQEDPSIAIPVVRLTAPPVRAAWGPSPVRSPPARKKVALLVFGEHGRELISAQVGLRLLTLLCPIPADAVGEAAAAAAKLAAASSPVTAAETATLAVELSRTELILLPLAVPEGRVAVERGHSCARLNSRGVDVNRNFAYAWGGTDATSLPPEEYPGPAPFSEAHPRRVAALVTATLPDAYVSVHAGDSALLTPWDCGCGPVAGVSASEDARLAEDRARKKLLNHAVDALRSAHCPTCAAGTAVGLFGYNAYGTGGDWVWAAGDARWVLTWEVYGDGSAHHDDCVRLFNPVGAMGVSSVVENWARAPFTLARAMHAADVAGNDTAPTGVDAAGLASGWGWVGGAAGGAWPMGRLVSAGVGHDAGGFSDAWGGLMMARVIMSAGSLGVLLLVLRWRTDSGRRARALDGSPGATVSVVPLSNRDCSSSSILSPSSSVRGMGDTDREGCGGPGDTYLKLV